MDADLIAEIARLCESAWSDNTRWETDLGQAEALLRAHLEREPECVAALTSLGAVLADAGRHADAAVVLRRAIALESVDANTYYNLAVALMNSESGRSQAMQYFENANALQRDAGTLRASFDPHAH